MEKGFGLGVEESVKQFMTLMFNNDSLALQQFRCTKENPCALAHCNDFDSDSDYSPEHSPIRKRFQSPPLIEGWDMQSFTNKIDPKVAERNARELIDAEEKAKNKAKKKKEKKERQRQKKLNKLVDLSDKHSNNSSVNNDDSNSVTTEMENLSINSNNKEVEELDINAAFVSKAIKKIKRVPLLEEPKPKREVTTLEKIIRKAAECESRNDFKEAIRYITEALRIEPKRIDLLLKRSLFHFYNEQYEKSIQDAQKVVKFAPNNPEGYFRLGEGHYAAKNIPEAESIFLKLINCNTYSKEATSRLVEIRVQQLSSMGYHPNEALTALVKSKNKTIDEAIEYLTNLQNVKEASEDIYYSDEEEEEEEEEEEGEEEEDEDEDSIGAIGPVPTNTISKLNIVLAKNHPILIDPSNPFGCSSLFVGNLKKDITHQEILNVFSKFGEIQNMKLTTEPNCFAFVNYVESESAGRAMEALQGSHWLLSITKPLLVRFPHNVVNALIPNIKNPDVILSKLKAIEDAKRRQAASNRTRRQSYIRPVASSPQPVKINNEAPSKYPVVKPTAYGPRPPPETAECYFWRTTGCTYGNSCFNVHIPEHKGIALQR